MWQSDEYQDKITIYGMYFEDKIRYDLKEGFRTAHLALPIELMTTVESEKNPLVEMPGIEPGSAKAILKMFS